MSGGTFSISNGGIYGSLFGTPIINPPQSAILGMHGITDRPVAIQGKVSRSRSYLVTWRHLIFLLNLKNQQVGLRKWNCVSSCFSSNCYCRRAKRNWWAIIRSKLLYKKTKQNTDNILFKLCLFAQFFLFLFVCWIFIVFADGLVCDRWRFDQSCSWRWRTTTDWSTDARESLSCARSSWPSKTHDSCSSTCRPHASRMSLCSAGGLVVKMWCDVIFRPL